MNSQLLLDVDEIQQTNIQEAPSSTAARTETQDMTPEAIKATVVALFLSALYLAISAAWLWSAMSKYQNCL